MKVSPLLVFASCLSLASSFRSNAVSRRSSSRLLSTISPEAIQASLPSPLIDAQGNVIESAEDVASLVQNQRVALYFGASWCKDCRNLEFMLAQYRSALEGSEQPIQLIYVPCDQTAEDQLSQMQKLGLTVGVPVGEVADALKQQYGVWPDADIERFGGVSRELEGEEEAVAIEAVKGSEGEKVATERVEAMGKIEDVRDEFGRRSGIPAFVVLDNAGAEFCFLNAERDSISVLADWPLDDPQNIW
jgi:thiol-disulfide isomerase/thioredoxin